MAGQEVDRSKNDFSKGPVWKCIVMQAVPLTIAQLVQLLYNVIDRIYIGHMGDGSSIALTGVGLTFPIVTLIMAFTALFGIGGVPLFSMARGAGKKEQAEKILGNSFGLLTISAVILTVVSYLFCRPILFLFGASEASYGYAQSYLKIYLIGTLFSMLTTGLNGYINAQGFPRIGMLTTVLGAVANIILDPIFIFVLDMGVAGAALATVIGQMISAVWVVQFLVGKKGGHSLKKKLHQAGQKNYQKYFLAGHLEFYYAGNQLRCSNRMQFHFTNLWRRRLCGDYDGTQFYSRNFYAPT